MLKDNIVKFIRDIPDYPKKGIIFRDITPLLGNPDARIAVLNMLRLDLININLKINAIAGIESRGFLFGIALADLLHVPFIPIRKSGKLPYKKISKSYDLEYGTSTIEMHQDAIKAGWNVLIHDDLLASGGTSIAAGELIKQCGGIIAGYSFIIELIKLEGAKKIIKHFDKDSFPVLTVKVY